MTYQNLNHDDGRLFRSFPEVSDDELDAAIVQATLCCAGWQALNVAARARVVARAAALVRERADELAQTMAMEMDKRIDEARVEVAFSAAILSHYADNAAYADDRSQEGAQGVPQGVIVSIGPWNMPCRQLARVAGVQVMAGNVLLVTHAGGAAQCALAFAQVWRDAGAPAGLFTALCISSAQSAAMIDDPRINGVAGPDCQSSPAASEMIAALRGPADGSRPAVLSDLFKPLGAAIAYGVRACTHAA